MASCFYGFQVFLPLVVSVVFFGWFVCGFALLRVWLLQTLRIRSRVMISG